VVNGILDMSKMESGNFEISPDRLRRAARCSIAAPAGPEGGGRTASISSPAQARTARDHRRSPRVQQILLNLVSNANKIHRARGTVTVSAAVEGPRGCVRVADNGVGISAEDLKRIGDPFFQAGKTYQRRHEGTGLGTVDREIAWSRCRRRDDGAEQNR